MQHLADAAQEANLLQVELSNNQPNLWRSELYPITLVGGTDTYSLPSRMIAVEDIYLRYSGAGSGGGGYGGGGYAGGSNIDKVIFPVSMQDYDAIQNKATQACPTLYTIFKTLSPTIKVWPVPDSVQSYTMYVRLLSRPEDVVMPSGVQLDMPYTYLDTYVAGMAYRMARLYRPDLEDKRKMDYREALAQAQKTDIQDNVPISISPSFGGYYR